MPDHIVIEPSSQGMPFSVLKRGNMNIRYAMTGRAAFASAGIAHLLAWTVFCWVLLWPHWYGGVSTTPTSVDAGQAAVLQRDVVMVSASFTEVNGWWALIPMFIPVLLTGLALMAVLIWKGGRGGITLIVSGLAVALLGFCGLGYLSFGVLYFPSALALIIAAIVVGLRHRSPRANPG